MKFPENIVSVNELTEQRRQSLHGGHGFVLGCPGSGKTLTVMEQIKAVLENSRDTVIVLDMDGSYRAFAEELDGQRIVLDGSANVFINPFDADMDSMSDPFDYPIWEKVEFFQFWLEELLGGAVFGVLQDHPLPTDRKELDLYGRALKAVFQKNEGKLVELIEHEYQRLKMEPPAPVNVPPYEE